MLLAVPRMEPPLAVQETAACDRRRDWNVATQSVTKYQLLLSNYFPKDHWSQMRPPKVFASSNEQAMLVLDDYKRHASESAINERSTTRRWTSSGLRC